MNGEIPQKTAKIRYGKEEVRKRAWRHTMASIPVDVAGVTGLLLPTQHVGQRAGVTGKRKVIGTVRSDDHGTTHIEAVEVARDGSRSHGKAVIVEVIAR